MLVENQIQFIDLNQNQGVLLKSSLMATQWKTLPIRQTFVHNLLPTPEFCNLKCLKQYQRLKIYAMYFHLY